MAEKKEETFVRFDVSFPNAPKEAKDREVLFDKLLSLIEDSKESLHIKFKSSKKRKQIILDSDEFMFTIPFRKKLSTTILLYDPEKNIDAANDVGNKVINFINIILGDKATNARLHSFKTIHYPWKTINLSKKLIDEAKLAKVNEEVRQSLNPVSIILEYKMGEKDFLIGTFSNEEGLVALFSDITYKDKLPFNFLHKEYDDLANPTEIIKKLTEMEL